MADIVNVRDLTIQAQLPRLLPIMMPGNITVPTTNVPGLPDYYASSKQVELKATSQIFQITKVGGISPSAIILTAERKNILGAITWTVLSGSVNYTTGNNTLTIQAGGLLSETATVRASVTSDGMTYSDVMTIVKVQEGVDSVTGFLTNESTSVPALASGAVLSYDNTGGQFRVIDGITEVTGTAVTYSIVSSVGVSISIANTGVYTLTSLTEDAGSAIMQATYKGVNVQKVYTVTKSKQGSTGITLYTWIKYADDAAGSGLSDSPVGKLYIGLAYNKTTPIESNIPSDYEYSLIKGEDGKNGTDGTNGIPGPPGANGQPTYTWIKYSDFPDGTNLYDTPNENTTYIGITPNRTTQEESTNKLDYVWSKFKGDQGVAGQNGVTTYTWIKYSDTATGAGLSDNPSGKVYIALAFNKTSPVESSDPADYTYSLIKGEQGNQGVPGAPGADGVTTYTWIKYSDFPDGTNLYDTPTEATLYIGIAVNKTTATESNVKTDYVWSKFKGDQGVPGQNGVTTYTWIKYADDAVGNGLSDSPTNKAYIGFAFNKTTPIESNTPSDYSFSLIKGSNGDQGVPGAPGADGVTLYTWIKYSDFPDGTDLYDTPNTNTMYIGIAVNKLSANESTNKADYSWSKFKGDQGVPGLNGSNGVRGTVNISVATVGNIWSDTEANNGIANAGYGSPQSRDIVTLYNTTSNFSQSKFFDGGSWQSLDAYINGNLLVNGSVFAEKIDSRGLSIKDSSGNVILSAGVPIDKNYINFGAGTGNLINNSGPFPGTLGGYKDLYKSVNGKTLEFLPSTDPYRPTGGGGVYARVGAGLATGEYVVMGIIDQSTGSEKMFPVVAGQRYEASMYLGAHRSSGRMYLAFVDASGNVISTLNGNVITAGAPAGALSNWEPYRSAGFSVAPPGSVYAIFRVEMLGIGGTDSYLFMSMGYIAAALPNQTVLTSWSDGAGATLGGNVFGQITPANSSTYIASAAIKLANIDTATISNLSVLSQTVGLLRTRATGARMEIADDVIRIFNDSNQIKIKIGNLDG